MHLIDTKDTTSSELITHHLLTCFIASGYVAIAYVDLGRMAAVSGESTKGKSIYATNNIEKTELKPKGVLPDFQEHTIVVVGVSTDDKETPTCLVHDPASAPFLKAPTRDLVDFRNYSGVGESRSGISPDDDNVLHSRTPVSYTHLTLPTIYSV